MAGFAKGHRCKTTSQMLKKKFTCGSHTAQAGAVGGATLQNFPGMHFSRRGGAQMPARRNSLVSNSEISAASDDDDAPAPVPSALSAAAASTAAPAIEASERRRMSTDAVIDVALEESAA